MLKAIIVDDEFPSREVLGSILKEQGVEILASFEDGSEILEFLKTRHDADAVFLDIQMRDMDGLTAAWKIIQLPHAPSIVFTTGYSQYAVEAFELNAIDYVLKPFSKPRLIQTIKKLEERKPQIPDAAAHLYNFLARNAPVTSPKMRVWSNERMIILDAAEIIYITSENSNGAMIHSTKGDFSTKLSLGSLEEQLGPSGFARTHKSFLVNLGKVREIVPWFNHTFLLSLDGLTTLKVPLARHYIKEFNKIFPKI